MAVTVGPTIDHLKITMHQLGLIVAGGQIMFQTLTTGHNRIHFNYIKQTITGPPTTYSHADFSSKESCLRIVSVSIAMLKARIVTKLRF